MPVRLLPLFDLRDVNDPGRNAPIPLDLAQQWCQYFQNNRSEVEEFTQHRLLPRLSLDEYQTYLERFVSILEAGATSSPRGLCIQDMLMTERGLHANGDTPLWSGLFADFMCEKYGVNGIIAIQSGEDSSWGSAPTYLITNLTEELLAHQHLLNV